MEATEEREDDNKNSRKIQNPGLKVIDYKRRGAQWSAFATAKQTMGVNHLPQTLQPNMNDGLHANAVYFDKVDGWKLPKHVFDQATKGRHQVGVQLSLSFFHLTSGTFFGNTWMSPVVEIDDLNRSISRDIDLQFQDMIYLVSKMADPTCVAVIEIVAGMFNSSYTLSSNQFGCGWTMLTTLFSKQQPADVADGPEKIKLMNCPIYAGSPRQLILTKDMQVLLSRLKEVPGCSLFFKLYSHRRLLSIQHLIKENEMLGRFDVISGLAAKEVIPPMDTKPRWMCCIGDEESMKPKDGVTMLPAKPKLALASTIELIDPQVLIPRRESFEENIRQSLINFFPTERRSEVIVLSRTLKFGLHNGHTVIGKELNVVNLMVDSQDRDILTTDPINKLTIRSYAPDENMAMVISVEYVIGIEVVKNDRQDARDILQSSQQGSIRPLSTNVCIGIGVYVPSDGSYIFTRNVKASAQDSLGIELPLVQEVFSSLVTTSPLATLKDNLVSASVLADEKRSNVRMSGSVDVKAAKDSGDAKVTSQQSVSASTNDPLMMSKDPIATFGCDMRIIHPTRGELKHEDPVNELKVLTDSDVATGIAMKKDSTYDERRDRSPRRQLRDEKGVFDDDDGIKESRLKRPRSRKAVTKERSSRYAADDGSDRESVNESIVSGDSNRSSLRVDQFYYDKGTKDHHHMKRDDDQASDRSSHMSDFFPKTKEIQLRSNLAQSIMNARFAPRYADAGPVDMPPSGAMIGSGGGGFESGFAPAHRDPSVGYPDVRMAKKTMVPMMHNDFFLRTLSRAAKSRLNRYGIQDAIEDTPYSVVKQQQQNFIGSGKINPRTPLNIDLEAGDELSLHEINIQFGGYRPSNKDGNKGLLPRAVYFSFQFFTCMPTRTEDLKLVHPDSSSTGNPEVSVLVRDLDEFRQEPGMVLRYIIDCSRSSPFEAIEFANYLSKKSLYIDVWDADSLLPIGTIGIPLKLLMRQGQPMVKHAIECDVINYEIGAPSHGGMTAMTIMDEGPISGELVGAVQVIIANYGSKGQGNQPHSHPNVPIEGLNWRAHGAFDDRPKTSAVTRPKNTVRAKPLTSVAPELSRVLEDVRQTTGKGGASFRSLGPGRDGGSVSTLNYDEVVTIFKRFQGVQKGTIQYAGNLMILMDLPSMSVLMKKLTRIYKLYGDQMSFKAEILRHANSAEELKAPDVEEFIRVASERTGVKTKVEERTLFAQKILADKPESTIRATDVVNYIIQEADRQDWITVSSRLRLCAQKAELEGHDVEQMLSDTDTQGSHYISTRKFRDFLVKLGEFGKLTPGDIALTIRMFSRHDHSITERDPVSLSEVMAALGKEYVGNLQARIRKLLSTTGGEDGVAGGGSLPEAKYIVRLLNDGSETLVVGQYSYEQVEKAFRALGVFNELSPAQVRSILTKMDVRASGLLTAVQVLNYLGIPYKASDLPKDGTTNAPVVNEVMNAEYILRLLLEKAQAHGAHVDSIFRHFDTNGDGQISAKELETGLEKLEIFQGIPNWKAQLPEIVKQFDSSGDGLVSLREFFRYLGIKDYAPNIIQRLTKIFAIATEQGLSFAKIFEELDVDKNNTIDEKELLEGLKKMGSFEGVSHEDVVSVIKIFDSDGNQQISLHEFVDYFTKRVDEDRQLRRMKTQQKVVKRFREVMRAAQGKGATIADIFRHLDKDKGGSVSVIELAESLSKLPNMKSLKKEEIDSLLTAIDSDHSGDITLQEFEDFVNAGAPPAATSPRGARDLLTVIRETFGAAIAKGLSIEQEFQLVDQDRSGRITIQELEKIIKKMPSFKEIAQADMKRLFNAIDTDHSGLISPQEFKRFVVEGIKEYEQDAAAKAAVDDKENRINASSKGGKGSSSERDETMKERFVRHMKRISEIDGSIRALLAYLDSDEDGYISQVSLFNLLRREDVFETVPEDDVARIIQPFLGRKTTRSDRDRDDRRRDDEDDRRDRDTSMMIQLVPFLHFLEGTTNKASQRLIELDYDDPKAMMIDEREYTFSTDPVVNAIEKKLRHFGRLLAKRGVDVEQLFRDSDPKLTGCILRTDFINVLGKLGMYLLEEGRVLQETNPAYGGQGGEDMRRRQLQQIKQLKGHDSSGGTFRSNAPTLARKMFHNDHVIRGGQEFQQHLESLTIIDWYRQSQKQQLLQHVLSHSLAHTIHLFTRFGHTLFFEYPLTNPFSYEERFLIEIPDPELRLVTNFNEWTLLRKTVRPCVGTLGHDPVEAEMFDIDPNQRGKVGVTLLPHETVYLPFTFLTLLPYTPPKGHSVGRITSGSSNANSNHGAIRSKGREDHQSYEAKASSRDNDDGEGKGEDYVNDGEPLRVINVRIISGTHGHVISILRTVIHPRPFIVHRILRCYEYEHTVAKRHVKLLGLQRMEDGYGGDAYLGTTGTHFVHCVETNLGQDEESRVVVEWGEKLFHVHPELRGQDDMDEVPSLEMLIRYRCGGAPTVGAFYLLLYRDPYQSCLHEVWQVIIHSRMRMDIHSTVGTHSAADVVVRGDRNPRRARAFGLPPPTALQLAFKPSNVFQLVPGAYNRVVVVAKPKISGQRRVLINVVDTDTKELLSGYLMNIHAGAPAVIRSYDVHVPVGHVIFKKILFRNPWDTRRKYLLVSSDEEYMKPRTESVEIGPGGTAYLRLQFSGWRSGEVGVREVHLFLQDAGGRGSNEECHLFRVMEAGGFEMGY